MNTNCRLERLVTLFLTYETIPYAKEVHQTEQNERKDKIKLVLKLALTLFCFYNNQVFCSIASLQ